MGPLLASCLLLTLAGAGAQESDHARAMTALEAKDYATAWAHLERERDPFWQASGRAYVLYGAGDYRGTLQQTKLALVERPGDLNLLYRAAWSAVLLGDESRSGELVQSLERHVEQAELPAEHVAFWDQALDSLLERSEALGEAAVDRETVQRRARWVSWGGLVAVLLFILRLGRG